MDIEIRMDPASLAMGIVYDGGDGDFATATIPIESVQRGRTRR